VAEDGSVRAFHNVCRHRAGPLVTDECGHCPVIVCGYHGWTYGLDGTLLRARDFGDATDFDPADFGLLELGVAEWRGLVFVRIAPDGPTLGDALGDLGDLVDRCADQPIDQLTYSHRVTHVVDSNWKTYTDNYGEGYHVPFVHPELNRQIDAREYRVAVHDHWVEHSAPTLDGAVTAGLWLWRFPNLGLNVYPEGMNVERWLPLGPRHTQITYDFFFADTSPAATSTNAEIERLGIEVLDEDRRICEAVQRNLEAGIYIAGRLSPRHENGVHAFQTWVRAALASYDTSVGYAASVGSSSSDNEFTQ
jgi:choline monooxygenase